MYKRQQHFQLKRDETRMTFNCRPINQSNMHSIQKPTNRRVHSTSQPANQSINQAFNHLKSLTSSRRLSWILLRVKGWNACPSPP